MTDRMNILLINPCRFPMIFVQAQGHLSFCRIASVALGLIFIEAIRGPGGMERPRFRKSFGILLAVCQSVVFTLGEMCCMTQLIVYRASQTGDAIRAMYSNVGVGFVYVPCWCAGAEHSVMFLSDRSL